MNNKFVFPQLKIMPIGINKFLFATFCSALAVTLQISPTVGADPFRTKEARNIGDNTEAAFKAIFQEGNYQAADSYLQKALTSEPDEPLAYAMRASLAYSNKDLTLLDTYSKKTLETAEKLIPTDTLRGHLYAAVGEFLSGALILSREGTVNGAPEAMSKLRQVYEHLDKAEAVSPQDSELNLIKGYMDLMLAVNLPFANPSQAIERLEKNASPQYLVDRGIAIAYRDLKQYPKALDYANRALKVTSNNPEVYYLKGQILRAQANKEKSIQQMREAVSNFDKALAKKTQLPSGLVRQIERERRNADKSIASLVNK
jgi:tetratricopeptide (TPR) repeat protein